MKFCVPLLLLLLCLQGRLAVAQRLLITGQVVEAATGEPVGVRVTAPSADTLSTSPASMSTKRITPSLSHHIGPSAW